MNLYTTAIWREHQNPMLLARLIQSIKKVLYFTKHFLGLRNQTCCTITCMSIQQTIKFINPGLHCKRKTKVWKWRPQSNLNQPICVLALIQLHRVRILSLTSEPGMECAVVNDYVYYALTQSHRQMNGHSLVKHSFIL